MLYIECSMKIKFFHVKDTCSTDDALDLHFYNISSASWTFGFSSPPMFIKRTSPKLG